MYLVRRFWRKLKHPSFELTIDAERIDELQGKESEDVPDYMQTVNEEGCGKSSAELEEHSKLGPLPNVPNVPSKKETPRPFEKESPRSLKLRLVPVPSEADEDEDYLFPRSVSRKLSHISSKISTKKPSIFGGNSGRYAESSIYCTFPGVQNYGSGNLTSSKGIPQKSKSSFEDYASSRKRGSFEPTTQPTMTKRASEQIQLRRLIDELNDEGSENASTFVSCINSLTEKVEALSQQLSKKEGVLSTAPQEEMASQKLE